MASTALATTNGAALIGRPLSPEEARSLTDEVKRDAHLLWEKLLLLYEGGAHTALRYPSWGAYYKAEFEAGTDVRGYQLLQAGRVARRLKIFSPELPAPANDAQARELAKAPEEIQAAVWREAVETAPEGAVTAAHVAEVVERRTEPEPDESVADDPEASPADDDFWKACREIDGLIGDLQDARRVYGARLRSADLSVAEIDDFRAQVDRMKRAVAALDILRRRAERRRIERGGKPMSRPARPAAPRRSIEEQFREYHASHPEVFEWLLREALKDSGASINDLTSRWKREHGLPLNNIYRSHYARELKQREPLLSGRFTTRKLAG